ncbi:methyltransferase [Microtetraspora niveoalba]|uniref:methyltransferase n=1 Tax=Microtetraspora niveoalba TaxID=46175 RepID=UPI0008357642|nr:methyltransferase [Microtetraspora niveoalba]
MIDSTGPVWDAIVGLSRFGALAAMAELGCADHLAAGPLSVTDLAARCDADATALGRVMRELAAMGVVRSVAPQMYELTGAGQVMRGDVPGSMRPAVRVMAEEGYWQALGLLPESVRRGRSVFVERHGPYYDYLAARPDAAREFNDYMATRAAPIEAALAASYDFSGVKTLVDVAGGKGHLLAAVLEAHPAVRGVLFDLEHVVEGARESLGTRGLADRCELVPGDFFAGVPAADAYLLASIIHNWNDEDALRILGNVREAMSADGRVLLLEMVLPDDDSPHIGKEIDLRMLALFGGRERTRGEYAELLRASGLALSRVLPLPAGASLIEALPV